MDEELIKDLYSDFTKSEVLTIAQELGIKADMLERSKIIIRKLLDVKLTKAIVNELSEISAEFFLAAEMLDDDMNIVVKSEVSKTVELPPSVKMPECYNLGDERDPACQKCKVKLECLKERIKRRPNCFKKSFSESAEECKICIEAPDCKE